MVRGSQREHIGIVGVGILGRAELSLRSDRLRVSGQCREAYGSKSPTRICAT
jgi:hypothetical protein